MQIRHQLRTAKANIADYVSAGKSDWYNWNPGCYIGSKIGHGIANFGKDIYHGDWDSVAYKAGGASVGIAEAGVAAYAAKGVSSLAGRLSAGNKTTTVGRWMSETEYEAMQSAQKVIPSPNNPQVKHVAYPSDINAFGRQAQKGSIYVEFDVPFDSVKPAGSGWARIPGPGSPESRLNVLRGDSPLEYPDVKNIKIVGEK